MLSVSVSVSDSVAEFARIQTSPSTILRRPAFPARRATRWERPYEIAPSASSTISTAISICSGVITSGGQNRTVL